MSGNVSEWTASSYQGNAFHAVSEMNPETRRKGSENDPVWLTRKTLRGGSWRDVQFYLQVSTRDYEFADTAKAYIGFRCIIQQIHPGITNRR